MGMDCGCGCGDSKKTAKYVCSKCGKEEMREVKEGEVVKSCCAHTILKKAKSSKLDRYLIKGRASVLETLPCLWQMGGNKSIQSGIRQFTKFMARRKYKLIIRSGLE